MKSYLIQTNLSRFDADITKLQGKDIQILLLFTSTAICKDGDLPRKIKAALPDACLLGCSTSGEIGERIEENSVTLMGIKFERSNFKCVAVPVDGAEGSKAAGTSIAEKLMSEDLAGIFVLLPGLNVNGSQFTIGLKEVLPRHVSISGGLAGDGLNFKETFTVFDDKVLPGQAVAFGVYGDRVRIGSGSRGGWKPFGPRRRVTRADHNILYEIDGKPALDLYKEYLGEKASDLPSSGLLYPFAIMDEKNGNAVGLIRTILDINEEAKSLVLAGDMEVGQLVCLMHANTDELVNGAEEAAKDASGDEVATANDVVICVSCVGRKILMGDDTEEELDAVRSIFSDQKIAGFYSYGEISIFQDTGEPELHNQTMTVTYITEDAA